MKNFIRTVALLLTFFVSNLRADVMGYWHVIIHNQDTNNAFSHVLALTSDQYYCDGTLGTHRGSVDVLYGVAGINAYAGPGQTFDQVIGPIQLIVYGCSGAKSICYVYDNTTGGSPKDGPYQFDYPISDPMVTTELWNMPGQGLKNQITTNRCFTVSNPLDKTVKAYWKTHGAIDNPDGVVQEQTLAAGQSGTRCFTFMLSDNTANVEFGWTASASNPDINGTNVWGSDYYAKTNLGIVFGNPQGGPGSSSVPGQTSAGDASSGVLWTKDGTGAASDKTLQDVGGLLHADNKDILDALHIIDNHVVAVTNGIVQAISRINANSNLVTVLVTNTGSSDIGPYLTNFLTQASQNNSQTSSNVFVRNFPEMFITNALGDIAIYTRSNNDAMWQMVGLLSNNLGINSNLLSHLSTNANIAFASNGLVLNFTNSLTNYATESTLAGISNNLFRALDTNDYASQVDSQNSAGESAAQDGKDKLTSIGSGLSEPNKSERYGTPTSDWQIYIPYLNGYTVNCDPFSYTWVNALASFIRNLIGWICTAGLFYRNIKLTLDTIQNLFTFRQTQTAGTSFFGNNLNSLSCFIVASAITAATLVVPLYFSNWFGASGLISSLMSHPMHHSSTSNQTLSVSIYIVDQFFPLAYMVWCTVVAIMFRAALAPILWLVGTVIRFLSGI